MFSHTFVFCLDPKYSVGCAMEGCSCGLVSITCCPWNPLSEWGWQHPCHLLWHEMESCLAWGWSSCHLQAKAVQWCSFDFVARIGGIWGAFPSLSPFPFHFPLFLPLLFFFPSVFFFPSLPGSVLISWRRESQPLIYLISCSY